VVGHTAPSLRQGRRTTERCAAEAVAPADRAHLVEVAAARGAMARSSMARSPIRIIAQLLPALVALVAPATAAYSGVTVVMGGSALLS
jgi:hypothetical protein